MLLCSLCSHPLSLLCLAYLLSTRPRFQPSRLSLGAHNQRPSQKGWETLHMKVKESELAQSCLTLRPHKMSPIRLLCAWDFPGKNTGVGCHFLLQGIFPTQGSNSGLQHYKQTLYHLNHQGSPKGANQTHQRQGSHALLHICPPHGIYPGLFRRIECPWGPKEWLGSSLQVELFCKMLLTDSEFKLMMRPWERNKNSNPISIFLDLETFCIDSTVFNDGKK